MLFALLSPVCNASPLWNFIRDNITRIKIVLPSPERATKAMIYGETPPKKPDRMPDYLYGTLNPLHASPIQFLDYDIPAKKLLSHHHGCCSQPVIMSIRFLDTRLKNRDSVVITIPRGYKAHNQPISSNILVYLLCL